jgi:hypothetical protein
MSIRKATLTKNGGKDILRLINPDICYIAIPIYSGVHYVKMVALPNVSEGKTAQYNQELILGRSFPMYTYSYSGDRTIDIQLHFFITQEPCFSYDTRVLPGQSPLSNSFGGGGCNQCADCNLQNLRALQSALYPREGNSTYGAPFQPPPVCTICIGGLLGVAPICAILTSCRVSFPNDVPWDESNFCPYRFDVDTSWLAVYDSTNLPYQSRIYYYAR